jgi:hypothetical protein
MARRPFGRTKELWIVRFRRKMRNPCGISATGNKRSDSPMAGKVGLERVSDN